MPFNVRLTPLILLAALGCSCTLFLGKAYERQRSVPHGMGVVYIYSGDIDATQRTFVDRDPTTAGVNDLLMMVEKGYYPYLASEGPLRIVNDAGDPDACIEFEVESGAHYFVRVTGAKMEAERIVVMPPDDGEREIATRRQMTGRSRSKSAKSFDVECPVVPAEGLR